MTREEKVQYWIDIADYDLETAEAMYNTGRWLYVAFMCHQVIEKTLKAYWTAKRDDDPPYIHEENNTSAQTGASGCAETLFSRSLRRFCIAFSYPTKYLICRAVARFSSRKRRRFLYRARGNIF